MIPNPIHPAHRIMLSIAERLLLRVADKTMSEQVDDALRHAMADINRAKGWEA